MKILVIGAAGQLGQSIRKVGATQNSHEIFFADRNTANILEYDGLDTLFKSFMPQFVVNCSAYTAVDKAESDIEACRKLNVEGPENLAKLCNTHGAVLVHVSTDFVFAGQVPEPLAETAATNPINVYGQTKLEGEEAVANYLPAHYIIRTSWLYSEFANNFVKTMRRLAIGRTALSVISDQVGTPTYAVDLAEAIFDIINSQKAAYGLYHFSNEGLSSWYDFAVAIFELSKTPIQVNPIMTSEYPTAAMRPKFSVMNKGKIKQTFGIKIPYWRESLARCIDNLNQESLS